MENDEITEAVLKLLDGRLSVFLTKSREPVRIQLMDKFWFFLLQETSNPRVSLPADSDEKVKKYDDIEEIKHGPNLRTGDKDRNKARYVALQKFEELCFGVAYELQASGVPISALRAPGFIRD